MNVHQRFRLAADTFYRDTGLHPTHCWLSIDVARQASDEHRKERRYGDGIGMFQLWDPTIRFLVEGNTLGELRVGAVREVIG